MFLKAGTKLNDGKYEIVRHIANGGFGCTYEAIHVSLKKHVAIKELFVKDCCIRQQDSNDVIVISDNKQMLFNKLKHKFKQEARAIASLSHSSIVNVSDIFEEHNTAYYVMDYIEGCSLSALLKQKNRLSEQEALSYIRQICEALSVVHKTKRLHLDIKPANIMIAEGKAILIDFGASKQYDEIDGENTSTMIGCSRGFAAIEQLNNEISRFLPSTDIYAIGATLYMCLSGIKPLPSSRIASGEKLQPLPNSISEKTAKAIYEAMKINKNDRPKTIEDFLSLLNDEDKKPIKHSNLQSFVLVCGTCALLAALSLIIINRLHYLFRCSLHFEVLVISLCICQALILFKKAKIGFILGFGTIGFCLALSAFVLKGPKLAYILDYNYVYMFVLGLYIIQALLYYLFRRSN